MLSNLQRVYETLKQSFLRFPVAILAALGASSITIFNLEFADNNALANIVLLCVLAFVTFVALEFFLQAKGWTGRKRLVANAAVLMLFVLYQVITPEIVRSTISWYRYSFLVVSAFMFLSLSPFFTKNTSQRFWAFNVGILMGIARSVFYGALIFIGLAIAWVGIQELFGLQLEDMILRTWIAVVGIFGPFFFFSQVPLGFEQKDGMEHTLKGAGLYILLPLAVVYFLIIYSYMIFILAKSELPQNVLGTLIVAYVLFGLLLYAGLQPFRSSFARGPLVEKVFLGAIIPQIAMLFWAIYLRVSEYGITEQRYLLIAVGIWFTVVTLYLLFSKQKDLRILPATVIVGCLIASVGPVSAFAVSRNSQVNRLKQIAIDIGALKDEKIDKELVKAAKEHASFASVVAYLWQVHGVTSVQPLFAEDLSSVQALLNDRQFRYVYPSDVEQFLGIASSFAGSSWKNFYYTVSDKTSAIHDIVGYDVFIPFDVSCYAMDCSLALAQFERNGLYYYIAINRSTSEVLVNVNKAYEETYPLNALIDALQGKYPIAADDMIVMGEGRDVRVKVIFDALEGAILADGKKDITRAAGTVLVQF